MKNRITLLSISIVAVLLFSITACKKYPQGGSVKKAEENLLGEWDMEKAYKNGTSVEKVNDNPQIGEVTEDWWFFENKDLATEDGNETLIGTWELTNNDQSIKVTVSKPSSSASVYTYEILQLDDKDMMWEQTINGDVYKYEFKISSKETPSSVDEI